MRALVLFWKAIGVKPSSFLIDDFVGKEASDGSHCLDHRAWATCPLLWPIRKASLRSVHWPSTGNRRSFVSDDQTNSVESLMWEVGAKPGYFSDGQRLVRSLWWRRWISLRTERLQLLSLAITWNLPWFNDCILETLKSAHVALGNLKQKFGFTVWIVGSWHGWRERVMLSLTLQLEKVMQEHHLMQSSCGRLLRLEIKFLKFHSVSVLQCTTRATVCVRACVRACVRECVRACASACVCSSIGAETGNQFFYLLIGWVGGSSEILMFYGLKIIPYIL